MAAFADGVRVCGKPVGSSGRRCVLPPLHDGRHSSAPRRAAEPQRSARSSIRPSRRTRSDSTMWTRMAPLRQQVIRDHAGRCHLCLHYGAAQIDHVVPVAEGGAEWSAANMRPAHGAPGNSCPTCGANCNQIRGMGSIERARDILQREYGGAATEPAEPVLQGREW